GRVAAVRPALPGAIPAATLVGTPVFLVQRVTYEFKSSVALPGRVALWRTIVQTGQTDEMVAPFDTTATFRFFAAGVHTAQARVPNPLINLRGLQLTPRAASGGAPG